MEKNAAKLPKPKNEKLASKSAIARRSREDERENGKKGRGTGEGGEGTSGQNILNHVKVFENNVNQRRMHRNAGGGRGGAERKQIDASHCMGHIAYGKCVVPFQLFAPGYRPCHGAQMKHEKMAREMGGERGDGMSVVIGESWSGKAINRGFSSSFPLF